MERNEGNRMTEKERGKGREIVKERKTGGGNFDKAGVYRGGRR